MIYRLLLILAITTSSFASAHPGQLASDGCHYCRTNCADWNVAYEQRHCHNSSPKEPPSHSASHKADLPDYDRNEWDHWIDVDKDCQNTRHELLISGSLTSVEFTNQRQCTVKAGSWIDPYSGSKYTYASDLDVDHIVPLHWAHHHGGAYWSAQRKQAFANDPDNLLLVDDGLNQAKGAQGPDQWMPPLDSFHCTYIKHFNHVVQKYGLTYSATELTFISEWASCAPAISN